MGAAALPLIYLGTGGEVGSVITHSCQLLLALNALKRESWSLSPQHPSPPIPSMASSVAAHPRYHLGFGGTHLTPVTHTVPPNPNL